MLDVTGNLLAVSDGDPHTADELLRAVYAELRRLAANKLAHETPGQTLEPTALVHEAYLRLMPKPSHARGQLQQWHSRGHFFSAAAEAMRRILVERARRKARIKHGGQWQRIAIGEVAVNDEDAQLLALNDALDKLAAEDAQVARVVELHHFAGLSHELVAETLEISVYQARQKWNYARAWLRDAIER